MGVTENTLQDKLFAGPPQDKAFVCRATSGAAAVLVQLVPPKPRAGTRRLCWASTPRQRPRRVLVGARGNRRWGRKPGGCGFVFEFKKLTYFRVHKQRRAPRLARRHSEHGKWPRSAEAVRRRGEPRGPHPAHRPGKFISSGSPVCARHLAALQLFRAFIYPPPAPRGLNIFPDLGRSSGLMQGTRPLPRRVSGRRRGGAGMAGAGRAAALSGALRRTPGPGGHPRGGQGRPGPLRSAGRPALSSWGEAEPAPYVTATARSGRPPERGLPPSRRPGRGGGSAGPLSAPATCRWGRGPRRRRTWCRDWRPPGCSSAPGSPPLPAPGARRRSGSPHGRSWGPAAAAPGAEGPTRRSAPTYCRAPPSRAKLSRVVSCRAEPSRAGPAASITALTPWLPARRWHHLPAPPRPAAGLPPAGRERGRPRARLPPGHGGRPDSPARPGPERPRRGRAGQGGAERSGGPLRPQVRDPELGIAGQITSPPCLGLKMWLNAAFYLSFLPPLHELEV